MQSVHSMLSSRMSELLDEFSPLWARYRARFMMPLSTSTHPDLIAELRAVEEMDLGDFTMLAAEAIHGNRSNWTELLRQEDVRQAFLEHAENASPERAQLAHRLVENPRRFRERLLAFSHAVALRTKRPPSLAALGSVRATSRAAGRRVVTNVRSGITRPLNTTIELQVHAICVRGPS